jgi:hypothetical protein
MIWIADAHRGNAKRFVAHADEKLTPFVQLESICGFYRGFRRRRWSEFPDLLTIISAL